MKNFNDEPQKSQSEQNGAERQNLPQFDNKPLIVKNYNIVVFFIYNLIFAPLAALVFLYIGDIFPYYTPLFGHIAPAGNSIGIVLSFIVIAVAFAGFLQSLRGFIIFIMSAAALILPFFISKLIFSKITEGKFNFRAIDTLIIYDGKGEFISFMMSGADFERVCRYMLKERRISPSKFQKQFVIFQ